MIQVLYTFVILSYLKIEFSLSERNLQRLLYLQTVEYEADQDGYRPRISYEDTGVRSGYSDNQSGYSGTQSGYSGSQSGYENQYPSGPY